jgi:branched-chain amino acid transport system permease protein
MFIAVVMFAPGGLAGLILMHVPMLRAGVLRRVVPSYLLGIMPTAMASLALIMLIEMTVQLAVKQSDGPHMNLFGVGFHANTPWPWLLMLGLFAGSFLLFRLIAPMVYAAWDSARASAREQGIIL